MKPIRVLIVDDHAVVARGLRAGFQNEPDIEVVGSLTSADGVIEAVDRLGATIVLMDVDMPGPDPFDAVEELHRLRPTVRAVALSAFTRDSYISAALSAGAWGFLSKSDEFDTILSGVRAVARGEFAFGPAAMARCELVNGRLRLKPPAAVGGKDGVPVPPLEALTHQEMQVLRMIARGASTKEIAGAIHRSEKRVEAVRTSLLRKLGCDDRVELTRYAIREGLVEP